MMGNCHSRLFRPCGARVLILIFIIVLLSLIDYQMEKYPINTIRHTLALVMAYAVKQMFPET